MQTQDNYIASQPMGKVLMDTNIMVNLVGMGI